jgi:hypothetical protein
VGLLQKLTDAVEIFRATGPDEYGNAGRDWEAVTVSAIPGFLASPRSLILGPDADVKKGDRVRVLGRVYTVPEEPTLARSPSASKALMVPLADVVEALGDLDVEEPPAPPEEGGG